MSRECFSFAFRLSGSPRFFRSRRKDSAIKNLAGALHTDGDGCTLSVEAEVKKEIKGKKSSASGTKLAADEQRQRRVRRSALVKNPQLEDFDLRGERMTNPNYSKALGLWGFLGLAVAILLTALPAFAADNLGIYQIDVEGGGALLIVTPSGQSMLIDSGSAPPATGERDSKRIAAAMQAAGLTKIDYLFITHYDGDHVGGVVAANNVAHFDHFFDHGDPDMNYSQGAGIEDRFKAYLSVAANKRTIVKPGDLIPLAGVKVQVVSAAGEVLKTPINGGGGPNPFCDGAEKHDPDKSENSRSAGVLLTYGRFTFLDLGDLTWDKEMALACPENKLGKVTLYLATHHGFFGDISGAPAHVWAVDPQVVIVNNGPRKALGQPAYERIAKIPGLEGSWQSHLALANDAAHNTTPDMIANMEDSNDCHGNSINVEVSKNGDTFTVTNTRNKYSKTYKTRRVSAHTN
jgi:competence protein ComEC